MNVLSKLLPLKAYPYIRYAKRRLFGAGSLETASYKQEVLCPEETQPIRPAIFLPGQLDRVTGTLPHHPIDVFIKSMLASEYQHAPTIAYHLKNAVLFDGSVYVGNYRHIIMQDLVDKMNPEPHYFREGAIASSWVGTKYFGQWLRDDCAQHLLADQLENVICLSTPVWPHKDFYARYFGQDWSSIDRAFVEHLVLFQNYSQNSYKRRRYDILRKRLRAKFPSGEHQLMVYLQRGNTGVSRNVENEDEIQNALRARHGFVIVDIQNHLDDVISMISKARIVVSMEGSNIAHCCFSLSSDAGLLVLMPPDRFVPVHREWSAGAGITFGFVVGSKQESGYRFSTDEILATIDLMLKSMGS